MLLIDLHSPLSKAECEKRLRERIHGPLETYTSVYGSATGAQFWLEHKTSYRNSFKTRLCGDVVVRRGETVICCRVGLPPVLMAIAVAFFTILPIATALMWLTLDKAPVGPLIMLAGAAALLTFGRFLATDEGDVLLGFVAANLEAAPRVVDTAERQKS